MKEIVTIEQQKVLDLIRVYQALQGTMPSMSYIQKELGYSFPSSAQHHVSALRRKGLLQDEGTQTNFRLHRDIPLVGAVSCGPAILALENIEAYIPVETTVLKKTSAKYFMLEASGDSMDLSDISDGDYLLVRQEQSAHHKDVVVALIGDDATCKQLDLRPHQPPRLLPKSSNPVHKPIIILENFSVLGVVEKIFKKAGGGWQAV